MLSVETMAGVLSGCEGCAVGVEFRLGKVDHKKVEDFLVGDTAGVSAVVMDARWRRVQGGVVEAAREAGVDVFIDPMTDRLTLPGLSAATLPYAAAGTLDVDVLARSGPQRSGLVRQVIDIHPGAATAVTAPHVFVTDERSAELNLALAQETVQEQDRPVRAVLIMSTKYQEERVAELAAEYARLGLGRLELRLSPFGGEELSGRQIRRGFDRLRAFTDAGLTVTAGWSGTVGQTAVARGAAAHYSVGLGLLESVDQRRVLTDQQKPRRVRADGTRVPGGPIPGIYLPGLMLTVPRESGARLIDHTDVRTRIGCRTGHCATTLRGPVIDPRGHYLHAHATHAAWLAGQPSTWRTHGHDDRLQRALELRDLINGRHLPAGMVRLHTRTLASLLTDTTGARQSDTA